MHPTLAFHQQSLVLNSRCAWCAERVTFRALVAGDNCPHCDGSLRLDAAEGANAVIDQVCASWRKWRWAAYGGLGLGTLLTSIVPLLAPLVFAVTMVAVQVTIVRRPMRWLGPYRRIAARLTLKLFLALLTLVLFVVSTALFPLLGVAQAVTTLLSVFSSVIYLETALWLVQNRLRQEAKDPRLQVWEVALPLTAMSILLATTAGLVLAAYGLFYLLLQAEIPGLSDIAAYLIPSGG